MFSANRVIEKQPVFSKVLFFVIVVGGAGAIPLLVLLLLVKFGLVDDRPGAVADYWLLLTIPAFCGCFTLMYLVWVWINRLLYGADSVRAWVRSASAEYNPTIQGLEGRFQRLVEKILG